MWAGAWAAIRRPRNALSKISLVACLLAERVGFEPTVRLHAQRFSRPSRSTTLAPLPRPAYRRRHPGRQHGCWTLENKGFPTLTWGLPCVYSAPLRRVVRPAALFRVCRYLGLDAPPIPRFGGFRPGRQAQSGVP